MNPMMLVFSLLVRPPNYCHKLSSYLSTVQLVWVQTTARRNSIPIDSLSFEYSVVNIDERELQQPPKEGVYVKVRHVMQTLSMSSLLCSHSCLSIIHSWSTYAGLLCLSLSNAWQECFSYVSMTQIKCRIKQLYTCWSYGYTLCLRCDGLACRACS